MRIFADNGCDESGVVQHYIQPQLPAEYGDWRRGSISAGGLVGGGSDDNLVVRLAMFGAIRHGAAGGETSGMGSMQCSARHRASIAALREVRECLESLGSDCPAVETLLVRTRS